MTGFFEEKAGERSMMRLLCFLTLLDGLFICTFAGIKALNGAQDALTAFTIGISLVGAGLAGKVTQKMFGEKADPTTVNADNSVVLNTGDTNLKPAVVAQPAINPAVEQVSEEAK